VIPSEKALKTMSKAIKIFKYLGIVLVLLLLSACASAKKNPYYAKRKNNSQVNSSQLGKNRYYFSSGYQKKLTRSYKRK